MYGIFVRASRHAANASSAAATSAASSSLWRAPAAAAATSAALHIRAALLTNSEFVSEIPRPVPRTTHYLPIPPPAIQEVEPLPLKKLKGAHKQIEPRITPQEGTHTLNIQPTTFRMQFQLEPATRTKVKKEGVNAKILDYSRAEAFTRAPWPSFREIVINRPRSMHALNPALILQIQNLIMALEFNKDITAGALAPKHGIAQTKLVGLAAHSLSAMLNDPTLKPTTYEKAFSVGMDMDTIIKAVQRDLEGKVRHKAMLAEHGEDAVPVSLEGTRDAHPGVPSVAKYFRSLYAMAFKMSNVRLHLVTILDGLTLGAGAGVFLQGRYRVATENTRIAYPQAQQGWIPDAGGSYTLSHLDGNVGMFLALTGYPVRGYDCVRLGLATHYCESDEVHRFGKRMGDSSLQYQFAEDTIEQAFGMFGEGVTHLPLPLHLFHRMIDRVFGVERIEEVFARLNEYIEDQEMGSKYAAAARELKERRREAAANAGNATRERPFWEAQSYVHPTTGKGWKELSDAKRAYYAPLKAKHIAEVATLPALPIRKYSDAECRFANDILNRLLSASPSSLKLIFKQIRLAALLPLEKCIQLEYRIGNRLLFSKDNPFEESDLFRYNGGGGGGSAASAEGKSTSSNWVRTNFKQISDAEVDEMLSEHWDATEELKLEYPQRKKPVWYI